MPLNSSPRNPYIAGKALGDERGFFGRADVQWLCDKEVQGFLTREEATKLRNLVNSIPKGVVSSAVGMGKLLLGEIFKGLK